ncbi:Carbonic anhydrase, GAG-binding MV membrane protein [Eptesipox virus]|uniref:Carbonic anhydrase 1 n=1 Tax=Eptesipox virus TaxID=1329402 RepID=A0A220T6E7_9POXV|nr:Carbonic anhydrase, GAG-binding MV membrane protein [Eptesipox virus]ASK51291.1 Carbonic anhydrase, GAG-binding MV membrane protein [Eptesipox virus]WAH71049.1 carbonic anhydrase, GAG-binding MV membrane protein [Eptesipox virus]
MYQQSPININTHNVKYDKTLKSLVLKYNNRSATHLINTGKTIKIKCNNRFPMIISSGPLKYNYTVEEIHLHWGKDNNIGSEHTVNGKHFSGEIHIVHWNSSKYKNFNEAYNSPDGIAIIAIFLQIGNYNINLQQITSNAHIVSHKDLSMDIYNFNPQKLFPSNLDYWYYLGSTTSNKHINNVHWLVFKNSVSISHSQLADLRYLKSTVYGTTPEKYIISNYKNPNKIINGLKIISSFKTMSDEECFFDKINIFTNLSPLTFIISIIVFILICSIFTFSWFFYKRSQKYKI